MEFCEKCGKILKALEEEEGTERITLVCKACGIKKNADDISMTEIQEIEHKKITEEVALHGFDEKINMPETSAECPECRHAKAYYWMEQTRAADEPPTRFYKCVKCGNVWREYS